MEEVGDFDEDGDIDIFSGSYEDDGFYFHANNSRHSNNSFNTTAQSGQDYTFQVALLLLILEIQLPQ